MTRALHRFTHCSRAAVARSRAARYSADSGSSSGSTSTRDGQQTAGQAGVPAGPRKCFSPSQPLGPHLGRGEVAGLGAQVGRTPAGVSGDERGDSHCSSQRPGSTISRPWVSASSSRSASRLAHTSCSRCCLRSASRNFALTHTGPWAAGTVAGGLRHGGRPAPRGSVSLAPPPGPGQAHSRASKAGRGRTWAPPARGGSRHVLPKQPVPSGTRAQDEWAQRWEACPHPGVTPGHESGGLRTPPAPHSAHKGHREMPGVQGRTGPFLPSLHSGRAVDKRAG